MRASSMSLSSVRAAITTPPGELSSLGSGKGREGGRKENFEEWD